MGKIFKIAAAVFLLLSIAGGFFYLLESEFWIKEFRIGFITDIHGYTNKKSDYNITPKVKEPLSDFVFKMNDSFKPDVVMDGGDFCGDSGREDEKAEDDFRELDKIYGSIEAPRYFSLGNHEMRSFSLGKWLELAGYEKSYYSFDKDNFRIIVLDGNDGCRNRPEKPNYCLSEEQFQWLEKTLKKPFWKKTIVFSHFPILDSLSNPFDRRLSPDDTQKLRSLFSRHQASAVFTGHVEKLYYEKLDGVEYFSLPGFYKSEAKNVAWYRSFYEISARKNVSVKMFYKKTPDEGSYRELIIPSEEYEKIEK